MNIKQVFSFSVLLFIIYSSAVAQHRQQLPPSPQVLQQYVQQHHLYPGGTYRYYDSTQHKSYIFSARDGRIIDPQSNVNVSNGAATQGITGGVTPHNFHLVQDINTSKDAYPLTTNYAYLNDTFVVLNNVAYYSADDGIHGVELWRSDGTTAGTYLVKDLAPGTASSTLRNLTVFNGYLLFSILNPATSSYQIWKSNGTEAGTVMVYDFATQTHTYPFFFTVLQNAVYFVASSGSDFNQLWKTDGTAAGTKLVKDLYVSDETYYLTDLVAANNIIFFRSFGTHFYNALWRSDGTDAGTYILDSTLNYSNQPAVTKLTVFDNSLYFANGTSTGYALWQSDGTVAGTHTTPGNNYVNISVNGDFFYSSPFIVNNKALYFEGFTSGTGVELFKYSTASSEGEVLVKDITPGTDSTIINDGDIVSVNGAVYFMFSDASHNAHLYKTYGTAATTTGVKDFTNLTGYNNLTNVNGTLYFVAQTDADGYEPWTSDGTAKGTTELKDVYAGAVGSDPANFTYCNNRVLFSATDSLQGNELWASDGSFASTTLVKDANVTSTSGSYPGGFSSFKNGILMDAETYNKGYELWESDGTSAQLVKDINQGQYGSNPGGFKTINGVTYFTAFNGALYCVYKTDGTASGTTKITPDSCGSVDDFIVTDNGNIFFTVYNNSDYTYQVWKTDGTPGGTILLLSNVHLESYIPANNDYNSSNYFTTAGNMVYFSLYTYNQNNNFISLWKSDGTKTGTIMLKDGFKYQLIYQISYKNELFFSGTDTATGNYNFELWKSDGTPGGTVQVSDVEPSDFVLFNNELYFAGYTSTNGTELWKTDGTTNGTFIVKDIYAGSGSSSPSNFLSINKTLYFSATDSIHGNELWKTDGSAANTLLVKNITPGISGNNYSSFTSAAGKLFFLLNDTLWQSDGNASGTGKVLDEGLTNVAIYNTLAGNGSKLFFDGYTYAFGDELYEGDVTNTVLPTNLLSFTAQLKSPDVLTRWQTADEADMAYFTVQRSTDVINFTNLGKVIATGNSSKTHDYNFTDVNVANLLNVNKVYYRLQITDKDGNNTFSNIVPVDLLKKAPALTIYPNPAKDVLSVQVSNYTGGADVMIQGANGTTVNHVQTQVQSGSAVHVNVAGLSAGTYFIELNAGGTLLKQKFVKQ